jgi:hypothetical protein
MRALGQDTLTVQDFVGFGLCVSRFAFRRCFDPLDKQLPSENAEIRIRDGCDASIALLAISLIACPPCRHRCTRDRRWRPIANSLIADT